MHNDHFINVQKPENENKTVLNKPSALSPREQLDVITWAANKAGKTYGQFSAGLSTADKDEIFLAYQEWQKERAAEIHERVQNRNNNGK